jgi:hypothetical protein
MCAEERNASIDAVRTTQKQLVTPRAVRLGYKAATDICEQDSELGLAHAVSRNSPSSDAVDCGAPQFRAR